MMVSLFVILFLVVSVGATNEKTEECDAWSKVEQDIKHKYSQVSCLKNKLCSGMNCSGVINGNEFQSGIQVYACKVPESFVLYLNVPKLGIDHWQQVFSHKDTFDFSDGVRGEINVEKVKSGFSVGLKMKITVPGSNYFPNLKTPLDIPIIQGVNIPVPVCNQQFSTSPANNNLSDLKTTTENVASLTNISKINSTISDLEREGNCTINKYTCPSREMCQQLKISFPTGICICLPEHRRNEFGECIHDPNGPAASGIQQKNDSFTTKLAGQGFSRSFLVVTILVPISCIIIVVIIAYAAVRLHICQYLRRRLRVQVYEQVLLSQDEENDEQLTDPVV